MDDIEGESERIQPLDFDDESNEEKIEANYELLEENPDETIKKKIFEGYENYKTENLVNKTLEVYKRFELDKIENGLDIIRKFFDKTLEFSNFNLSERLIDFFEFILLIPHLKFEDINKALNENFNPFGKDSHDDIIFSWKQFIVKENLKKQNILFDSEFIGNCLKLLLKHKFSLNEINFIFSLFRNIIISNNISQFEIINSLISIIILYPHYLNTSKGDNKKEEEITKFFNDYIIQAEVKENKGEKKTEFIFDKNKNVALDFYIKASSEKNDNNSSSELTIPEIFQNLKINNSDISEERINTINEQLNQIQIITEDKRYKNFQINDYQNWTKTELPLLKFDKDNSNRSTAIILGMISLVIKKKKNFFLRNTQLIAILLFISKEKKKGLIEEISTGEGKSCIIASLSMYYALRKHKVDIISSSYTLAQRDSDEFKEIYEFFNLKTNYPFCSNPEPYKADILYGTFLEFEGDCLRDIEYKRNIRNKRPFDVIIIDEVDNLFIDNILGSTRLTNSSRGFKFLIPSYLMVYLVFELIEYVFLLMFKINLDNLENPEIKNKFEKIIKNPKKRKEEIVKFFKSDDVSQIFHLGINNNNKDKIKYKKDFDPNELKHKFEKAGDVMEDFFDNLEKFVEVPDFLDDFREAEGKYWLDSAYNAKNLMDIERDYVEVINRDGNRDIAPVDRTNTGETQLSTVYGEGLHQMLEIKHKYRVNDETLVHTFLSHITFFQYYKKEKEFLFFGLTGTIGNKETQAIYKNKYIDSELLFIPQYKKKRFIELPPILVDTKDYFDVICKDIILNFYKGRKILVICSSIKEAKILEEELKYHFKVENLGIKEDLLQKENYRESIILYTRSDTEQSNFKVKKKRIILSTNLGGRGTDIQTTEQEEEAGGLHVILTYMPKNFRVLKQAFGRTSREGKKGTGQLILGNTGYKSYSEIKKEMIENEKKEISYIQKKLEILLFKDKLFKEYIELVKDVDLNGYLIDDINERWANFLRINISNDDELKMEEVSKKFEEFKSKIAKLLKEGELPDKFINPFYRMQEGFRKNPRYENKNSMLKYFDFDGKFNKFYFTQPYIKAIINIITVNNKNYDNKFFEKTIEYFDESIDRIKLLIEENIDPVLNSFEHWEIAIKKFESALQLNDNFKFFADIEKPFTDINFSDSDFYKQYFNIKNICNKIIERIEDNKRFIDNFKKEYEKDKRIDILITEENLVEGLSLNKAEQKEEQFFSDATFLYVYQFSIKKVLINSEPSFWKKLLVGIISFLAGLVGALFTRVAYFAFRETTNQRIHELVMDKEISTNSIVGNVLFIIIKYFSNNKKKSQKQMLLQEQELPNEKNKVVKSSKDILFEKILENIDIKFKNIKKSEKIINFLIFVDYYYSENIWSNKIKEILKENFEKIYKAKFIEDESFKAQITNANFKTHLINYDNLFNSYLEECIKGINNLGIKKKFNKKTGINSLEHLIIDLNSDVITEDIADKIVKNILKYRLLSNGGLVNQRLFSGCFQDKNGDFLEQNININITSFINQRDPKEKISDLKDFKINGFPIPLVNASFKDLSNFYKQNSYNVQQHLEKDFALYIVNNLKKIIISLLNMDNKIIKNFYEYHLAYTKRLVKNLLQEKKFSKYSKNSFENIITSELTEEEVKKFDELIHEVKEGAINLIKNK